MHMPPPLPLFPSLFLLNVRNGQKDRCALPSTGLFPECLLRQAWVGHQSRSALGLQGHKLWAITAASQGAHERGAWVGKQSSDLWDAAVLTGVLRVGPKACLCPFRSSWASSSLWSLIRGKEMRMWLLNWEMEFFLEFFVMELLKHIVYRKLLNRTDIHLSSDSKERWKKEAKWRLTF